jgi:hypothetical protein
MSKWLVTIEKPQHQIRHTRTIKAENEIDAFIKTAKLVGGPKAHEYMLKRAIRCDD